MFKYVVNKNAPDLPAYRNIGDFLGVGLNVLMGVGLSLSVIFIGISGIRYLSSGGNPDNVDQAKRALTYSIVALVLSVGAVAIKYIIINSILGVTHVDLIDATPVLDL